MRVSPSRRGFTLVEILIVITIILLLAVMTAYAINWTQNADKVRAAARQIQSYLAGARDRAIYAKAQRGVRFHLDSTNNRTVTSMTYIQATPSWTQGLIQLERLDLNNDGVADVPGSQPLVVRGFDGDPNANGAIPTNWVSLWQQGLLIDGMVITLPNAPRSTQYAVDVSLLQYASLPGTTPYYPPRLKLTTAYVDAADNINGNSIIAFTTGGPLNYSLTLPPGPLPGADVIVLPKNTCIHLDRSSAVKGVPETPRRPPLTLYLTYVNSLEQAFPDIPPSNRGDKLPESWKNRINASSDPSGFDYSRSLDIMFNARGTVTGSAAQRGLIQFYICEQKDADMDRSYWVNPTSYPTSSPPEYGAWTDPFSKGWIRGDKVIMSLFTRTGTVGSSNVAPDVGTYQDPFKFAETGQIAGK